ncbi:MAG TPA: FlgD immunoglobulin-like domain containing protein [Acidobacteriota bacterium]|nr:FlgD immunoglobulin-like domain containing protein [Acidobacteriota bacterium]
MRPDPRPRHAEPSSTAPDPATFLLLLAVALLLCGAPAPRSAAAPLDAGSLGTRLTPLADSPEYGQVARVADSPSGAILVATRDGLEVRLEGSPGGAPVGRYRGAHPVAGVAGRGTRAYLIHAQGGLSLLDISDPAAPALRTTLVLPVAARHGAVLDDGSIAASSDSFVQVVRLESGSDLRLIQTLSYSDGRRIARIRARHDSLLVAAFRTGALPRLYLTLYRLAPGAESLTPLKEILVNGQGANDLAWDGMIAFVANGSAGILAVDLITNAFLPAVPIVGARFVRAIDADAASVFAAGEAATFQRFARSGARGEILTPQPDETLELEPIAVAAAGGRGVAATRDAVTPAEPDEVGRSQLEFPLSAPAPVTPIEPVRSIGRARRVAVRGGPSTGLAFVAAYTGGLRIYRAGGADTSLVGHLPPLGNGRTMDVAIDPDRADRLYLASGTAGVEVVDISDPAAPVRLGSLVVPGLATAVAVVDPNTVAVARAGVGVSAGVTLVDVSTPTGPAPRGSVNGPFIMDPRSLAVRDTVLFVADEQLGVLSVGIGNPDAPATFGLPSGSSARDLDLLGGGLLPGTTLLVGSRSGGLQVVDVTNPASPVLRSKPLLPPILGVARQGTSALACLGEGGAALVDLTNLAAATVRSVVASGGIPRDAAWTGDTLLIAAGTSVERYLLPPAFPAPTGLEVTLDPEAVVSRARIAWAVAPVAGQVGWSVLRDRGIAANGTTTPRGVNVDELLLDPSARETFDEDLAAGLEHRYRLEAVFEDGRLMTVAEGRIFVPSNSRVGRPYPNPFRRGGGGVALPYRVLSGGGGVTLRVVDVRGRHVRTITATAPAAGGFGEIRWDGRGRDGRTVPTGVYYLYLRGPGLDDARSVVHLR